MTTRVALLGRNDAVRATLRSALVDAGAELAFEGELQGADAEAIRASVAKILIVNLEAGADSELDSLDALIEDPDIDVLFNEADVTGQLAGWDLARWARHLAAKVLGHGDATPPPPPGAEMLPERNLVPKPGKPNTPAEDVGDSDLSSFADEASASLSSLPESTLPDVLSAGQGRSEPALDEAFETSAEATDEDAELPRLERDSPISAALDTAGDESNDDFEFDLGEIESALSGVGGNVEVPLTAEPSDSRAFEAADEASLGFELPGEDAGGSGNSEPFRPGDETEYSEAAVDLSAELESAPTASGGVAEDGLGLDLGALDAMLAEDVGEQAAPLARAVSPDEEADEETEFATLDLGDLEASLADIGSDDAKPPHDEAPVDEGMGLDFDFDLNVGESDGGLPSLDEGEAAVSLEDDADFAALAAQFDAQSETSGEAEVAFGLDDIGLRGFDDEPENPGSATGDLPAESIAVPSPEAGGAPVEGQSALGSLSLLDLDAEIESRQDSKAEKSGNFDFDSLSLDLELEPIESEEDKEADFITEHRKKAAPQIKGIPRIFVLGASIGGPDALRTFISHIPADFPGLFVLAQHLESGFFSRLAHQLQKTSKMLVRVADDGQGPAKVGQLLVVTSAMKFDVDREGKIKQTPYEKPPHYKPCIDDLFIAAADTFGKDCVAIIFSGMAGDAVEGASHVTAKGGEVWVQDPSSCVVSSMVDGAKARGAVEYSGSPRELAERCVARFGKA